jgi:hypothetical protein
MARTVNRLIEQAFRKAGLFTQDRIIQGYKINEALDMLNDILDENSSEMSYVAFYEVFTFAMTPGQREYTIGRNVGNDVDHNRIVALKQVSLIASGARYPVNIISDNDYYSVIYYESAQGRPSSVFFQNEIGQSNLIFISKPDIAYDCEIKAKFILSNLALNTDITNVPPYYLQYLKYALAKELALEYLPANWTAAHESRFKKLENHLRMMNDYDVDLRLSNALIGRRQWYYNNLGVKS